MGKEGHCERWGMRCIRSNGEGGALGAVGNEEYCEQWGRRGIVSSGE